MACTVAGILSAASGSDKFQSPVGLLQRSLIDQGLNRLFHEERGRARGLDDQALEGREMLVVAKDRGQHFFGVAITKRFQPELLAPGQAAPSYLVLRPIGDQQEKMSCRQRVDQRSKTAWLSSSSQCRSSTINIRRISSGFGNNQTDNGLLGSGSLQLRVHSLEPLLIFEDLQEGE